MKFKWMIVPTNHVDWRIIAVGLLLQTDLVDGFGPANQASSDDEL
jgi:hypothetical protein